MPWELTGNSSTNPDTNFIGTTDNQAFQIRTSNFPRVRVTPDGIVGIRTTEPQATLDVQGQILSSGSRGALRVRNPNNQSAEVFLGWLNDVARIRVGGTAAGAGNGLDIQAGGDRSLMRINDDGTVEVPGDVRLTGADCAEDFDIEESQALDPGTVMVIGDEEKLSQCTKAHDKRVAGVLSGAGDSQPAIILGRRSSQYGRRPLALTGKVYCKVDSQYAPIGIGDLLTTSETPGHAMKASDPLKAFGAILGKALRPLRQGEGLIPILIALQ